MEQKTKIVFIVLSVLVFSIPIGQIGRLQISQTVTTTITDILVLLTLGVFFTRLLFKKERMKGDISFLKLLMLFGLIGAVSLLVNSARLTIDTFFVSFLYLFRWMTYAFVSIVAINLTILWKRRVFVVMGITGGFTLLAGYMQYFFYPDLRNLYYLGWDEHLYRMFGTFLDPNFTGAFLVLYSLLLAAFFVNAMKRESIKKALILGLLLLLCTIAVFLTYSRSSLIMLFTSATLFFLLLKTKKDISYRVKFFVLAVFILCAAVFSLFSPRSFQTEGTNLLRTASIASRSESMQRAITIFLDNPLLGVGFNAYRYAKERYGFIKEKRYTFPDHAGAGVENSYLFVLVTTGIVGFLIYTVMWFSILRSSYKKRGDVFSLALFSSTVGLLVHAMFINSLFYPSIMLWIWVLAGITARR